MSKFDRAAFLIFVLVFVSRDFELGTNISCEESTVSPRMWLILPAKAREYVLPAFYRRWFVKCQCQMNIYRAYLRSL